MDNKRLKDLKRFYSILGRLEKKIGGARILAKCTGRMDWPQRGVYFFRENGEKRTDTGNGPRIVRVGTHALISGAKTTLWSRLAQHKGSLSANGSSTGGASIFRNHICDALICRYSLDSPTKSKKIIISDLDYGEPVVEHEVDKYIQNMPFLWLSIEDKPGPNSVRGYIEKNSIALLSNYPLDKNLNPLDPPSVKWLGHYCDRERVGKLRGDDRKKNDTIRKSGLWNSRHVNDTYEPDFLKVLDRLVSEMKTSL
jgi:hypothetical protein